MVCLLIYFIGRCDPWPKRITGKLISHGFVYYSRMYSVVLESNNPAISVSSTHIDKDPSIKRRPRADHVPSPPARLKTRDRDRRSLFCVSQQRSREKKSSAMASGGR